MAYETINNVKNLGLKILIFAGGAHPTIDPIDVLNTAKVDDCIVGEGEETTYELLKKVLAHGPINDIAGTVNATKNNGMRPLLRDIDFLPAWEMIDFENYDVAVSKKKRMVYVLPIWGAPTTAPFAPISCGSWRSLGLEGGRQKISLKKSTIP